jgi:multidrug efflux pump subunit AcrA (membrane-fusion protein)
VGVALYVSSILAADSRTFTGVVSSSGIASLNFETSGRVGSVRVHLGQMVRKGEVLATEAGAASAAAVQADRAVITADKANLAALQADGSAPLASPRPRLSWKGPCHRAADRMTGSHRDRGAQRRDRRGHLRLAQARPSAAPG